MEDAPQKERPNYWKWFLWLASGSTFACGSMYLWGYWRYFGVSFLDYIEPQDIITKSVLNVAPLIVFCIQMLALSQLPFLSKRYRDWSAKVDAKSHGRGRFGIPLRWILPSCIALLMIFMFCVPIFVGDHPDPEAGLVFALPCFLALIALPVAGVFFGEKAEGFGASVGFVAGFLPMICFACGGLLAENTKFDPKRTETVVFTDFDAEVKTWIPDPVYVGQLGEFVFLASKTKCDTLVIHRGRVKAVEIWEHKNAPKPNHPDKQP